MYCSKCGAKLSDSNQNFCHNCGTEIISYPKTASYKTETSYKTERPQTESPPVYYVPVKYSRQLQKGLPGKNSKLCLGLAIASIVLGFVPFYIYYINIFLNLFLRVGGLILGVSSKMYSLKAVKSEPYNNLEKAGSIIGILAIIFNAIGLMVTVLGILDVRI